MTRPADGLDGDASKADQLWDKFYTREAAGCTWEIVARFRKLANDFEECLKPMATLTARLKQKNDALESEIAAHLSRPPAPSAELVEAALKDAIQFVENGIELGFIRMPDADTPDRAHGILDRLRAALAENEAKGKK